MSGSTAIRRLVGAEDDAAAGPVQAIERCGDRLERREGPPGTAAVSPAIAGV